MTVPATGHALLLRVGGRVQGVGFRPFVYRAARQFGIQGWVANQGSGVLIQAQGEAAALARFTQHLLDEAPPLAEPVLIARSPVPAEPFDDFTIRASLIGEPPVFEAVPPDYVMCEDCLAEVRNRAARRYRYPFTHCTQCGPRYTLIRTLPYDRANTAMAEFPLCEACRREYEDPGDRRFHAQALACPECGPRLWFRDATRKETVTGTEAALSVAIDRLRTGEIVAVKGVGGYHLLCDARNPGAVSRLRDRKGRPHKPLAVLFPLEGADGLSRIRATLDLRPIEAERLCSPERPIVLCRPLEGHDLAPAIAPGLNEIGAMLPYSPLHYLLTADFNAPLVATSGNLSGEPVLTEPAAAERRLAHIADAFLHHDRPILRPADDSVERVIAERSRPLRTGRGKAPCAVALPFELSEPILAVGGHMKNTVTLAWERQALISPHIGDLDSPRSREVFAATIADLQQFSGTTPDIVVCDLHPDYASSRWAAANARQLRKVPHHHAHASALHAEYAADEDWLVFTWDGVGLGEDGTLWGGEALLGRPGRWLRVATLRPFRLPGGEKASREPRRSALALLWETGRSAVRDRPGEDLLKRAWERRINTPQTSAAGRLFDAAASLLGLIEGRASFEGQGPMLLEAHAETGSAPPDLTVEKTGDLWCVDWEPLLPLLLDAGISPRQRAGHFHSALAAALVRCAGRVRAEHGISTVGLTGGVFQNRKLVEETVRRLLEANFTPRLNQQVPCGDAGLSYGQAAEAAAILCGPTAAQPTASDCR